MAVAWSVDLGGSHFRSSGSWINSRDCAGDTVTFEVNAPMANRKHTMDLAMVLDRVERISSVEWTDEGRDIMWHALYRDLLIAISQNKCADPIACAAASLRPGTITDEAGV